MCLIVGRPWGQHCSEESNHHLYCHVQVHNMTYPGLHQAGHMIDNLGGMAKQKYYIPISHNVLFYAEEGLGGVLQVPFSYQSD